MSLPELRDWTIIRLSFSFRDCVLQGIVATGRVFNRAHTYDGQLLMTTKLAEIRANENLVRTQNTVYRLSGPACPIEAWDPERYEWSWKRANFDFQCLSQMEDVKSYPEIFHEEIRDPEIIILHRKQTDLLAIINIATDIDNGLGRGRDHQDVLPLDALGVVVGRTSNVDLAVELAHKGRRTLVEEFGGLSLASQCPVLTPSLALVDAQKRYVATRLIPFAEGAGVVADHLPKKLGPWARTTWFILPNPNTPNFCAPISLIELGEIDTAIRAAEAFPRIARSFH